MNSDVDISPLTAYGLALLYLGGWIMTRGANMQKFLWRTQKNPYFLFGLIQNFCVPGSGDRILCTGFWAASRHINYCGEIIQAIAIALCGFLGRDTATGIYGYVPWLYPLYYIALFIPRQIDDDKMCERKYGLKTWNAYRKKVPFRIFPGVY